MQFGLEKESLVFDHNFHPYRFPIAMFDENTTLDFCDHQLELVSNVCDSVESLHLFMNDLALAKYPRDGYVWPISPINCCLDYTLEHPQLEDKDYHRYLATKYDTKMLLTSGIHFNVSGFSSSLIDMCKKLYIYAPLILPFFSFSPIPNSNVLSSRNTNEWGYYNEQNLDLDFSSLQAYNESIDNMIACGKLNARRELYSRIRIKYDRYLELRFIDLNPNYLIGISYEGLKLLETLIRYLDQIELGEFDFHQAVTNFDLVAKEGRDLDIDLTIDGKSDTLYNHMLRLLNDMQTLSPVVIDQFIEQLMTHTTEFEQFAQDLALHNNNICQYGKTHGFDFKVYQEQYPELNMELSTKVLMNEADKQGLSVKVLSESDNVISINDRLIVQATKTNVDHYANILMLENKKMTKMILDQHGINTPHGIVIEDLTRTNYEQWKNQAIVIKPLDTNFGLGISILDASHDQKSFEHALNHAFSYGQQVIIEQFITGLEYRFLVIGDQCVSIIHREACNVIGDGEHTIKELIDIKNENPLRGQHYNRPLEKIKIDLEMELILKEQGLSLSSVLADNQKVYLRKNSNVSTGGDSYEKSDYIPQYFKDVAIKAAKALNVKICGIDMIIPNVYQHDYAIIEANFNPALHMHAYPLYGIGKDPSKYVINEVLKTTTC